MLIKRAYYLGMTGSLGGMAISVLVITPLVNFIDLKQYSQTMGIAGVCFSLIALIACFLLKRHREISACFLMLISAVGGIISMSLYYIVPAFFLIFAGILTILNEETVHDSD